eukprot:gene21240-28156_t
MISAVSQCVRGQNGLAKNALLLTRSFAAAAEAPITVEVQPFMAHRIEPPSTTVETNLTELKSLYEMMYKFRRMEIAGDMMYKAKLIRGFCHLYDGQEAVLMGIESVLNHGDSIVTSYRDHCHHLTRGGTVAEVMAELMGRATGATKGLGGSMHMYNKKNNFYGGNGIVGAQIPLGAGLALGHKFRKEPNVAVTMYGDGAANQGQKYEALNMAGLWNLPCIFICENNHYGMGTAEWRGSKSPNFYTRGDYIPGLKADGMDVLAVKQVMTFAKKYALEHGPIVLELDTYRYHGHSMSDPGSTYRSRDEINAMRQERDPIERIKKLYLANGESATDQGGEASEMKRIEKEIKKEVDAAVDAAKKGPMPPLSWAWKNVYADPRNATLRNVQGEYVPTEFDLAYKL